jgi:putative PIN family toxin of toxin-antitoxin system
MSIDLTRELVDVMRRDKFDRYLTRERRDELVASTIRDCELVEVSTIITECRDIKDNKLLELAIDGNAVSVVTGDSDLLVLHPFKEIAILTPTEFLAQSMVT